jgi:hypothetical protein
MANKDRPFGLRPVRDDARLTPYLTAGVVYEGDVVTINTDGAVVASTADDGDAVIGVASHYAASGVELMVYDCPSTVFRVQTGGTLAAIDIGASSDHVATAGNAVTLQSKHEFNVNMTGEQLKIVRKVDVAGNDWGEFVELEVIFGEHYHNSSPNGI